MLSSRFQLSGSASGRPSDVSSGPEFGFHGYRYGMFLNDIDSDQIYVGGDQVLLKVDVNDYRIIEVGAFLHCSPHIQESELRL